MEASATKAMRKLCFFCFVRLAWNLFFLNPNLPYLPNRRNLAEPDSTLESFF